MFISLQLIRCIEKARLSEGEFILRRVSSIHFHPKSLMHARVCVCTVHTDEIFMKKVNFVQIPQDGLTQSREAANEKFKSSMI